MKPKRIASEIEGFCGTMAFSKLRNLAVKTSSLISEGGLSQSRRHSSTKYSRQVPRISLKDEVAGRREYCEVAQFAASSNESFAPSSSINVKGEKKKYTSYDLIESLYHLTEDTAPFKIPNIKSANSLLV